MNKFFCMILFLCTGCLQMPTQQMRPNGIIELHYTQFTSLEAEERTNDQLRKAASLACPAGYSKIYERIIPGDLNAYIWEIKCQ